MNKGIFTVGLLLGAGFIVGAAGIYGAWLAFLGLAAVVWLNLGNPALYIVLAALLALALFSTKQKAAPKDGL